MNNRYQGEELLWFLERYVLAVINEITDKDLVKMDEFTPYLQKTFGSNGTWIEIIEQIMDIQLEGRAEIVQSWEHNLKMANFTNEAITPEAFSILFVDKYMR